jgi:hypothetical protein
MKTSRSGGILISALERGEWSASRLSRFNLKEGPQVSFI